MRQLALAVAVTLGISTVAQATQRTFTFTAVVATVNDPAGAWDTSGPVHLVVSYDDTLADSNSDPRWGNYNYSPAFEPTGLWLYMGGEVIGIGGLNHAMGIGIDNDAGYDSLQFNAHLDLALEGDYELPQVQLLCGGQPTALPDDALPGDLALDQFANGCLLSLSYKDSLPSNRESNFNVTALERGNQAPQPCYLAASGTTSHTLRCEGTAITVPAGSSTLARTTPEPAGANCTAGGQRIDLGQDDGDGGGVAGDGVLQAGEVDESVYVCNGSAGATGATGETGADGAVALIALTSIESGATCAAGGEHIEVGVDNGDGGGTADDGVLQSGEVDHAFTLCNGETGPAGATGATGAAGENGAAGAAGATGATGSDGADGADALIDREEIAPGVTCAAGGYRIFVGTDENGDGLLAANERDHELTLCNGAAGADGEPGPQGPGGCNALQPLASVAAMLLVLPGALRRRRWR